MRLILVSALCMVSMVSWGQTSILGKVEDGEGKAVAGVSVALYGRPPLTVAAGAPRTQSGADGGFRFDGLTPGPYQLCAASPQLAYPDTCAWNPAGPKAHLVQAVAGQAVTVPAVRVTKGVRLRVNVVDSGRLLDRDEPRPHARLQVRVGVPGAGFTFLPVVETGGTQRGYELLVPRGQVWKVNVRSSHFSIADEQGRALNALAGQDLDVTAPVAGALAPVTLRVVGTR